MKILILRFSSIGDIVLTSPVMRCIKQQVENAEVHFCTKKNFKSLIEHNPYIDKYFLLEDKLSDLITKLKEEKYDYIIDLHNNLRTQIIKLSLWNVKSLSFDKINWQKFLYVKFKIKKFMPNVHIVDRYLAPAIKAFGIKNDDKGLDYFIPEKDNVPLDWLPTAFQKGFVAYAIGGQYFTKQLPKERIIEVCERINKPIILLGGKEDSAIAEEIEQFFTPTVSSDRNEKQFLKEMDKNTVIFNACGKFNLNQSASLLKQAALVISHDTGLMHIASAFQQEIYSIWGNTTPELGFYPYQTKFTIYETKDLDCRPCSKIGFHQCPKGHFKCMKDIKFDFYIP